MEHRELSMRVVVNIERRAEGKRRLNTSLGANPRKRAGAIADINSSAWTARDLQMLVRHPETRALDRTSTMLRDPSHFAPQRHKFLSAVTSRSFLQGLQKKACGPPCSQSRPWKWLSQAFLFVFSAQQEISQCKRSRDVQDPLGQ
jgi:hypothetical protein